MKKECFLCLCCILLTLTAVPAEGYHTDHFTINSDLNPAYVKLVQANAEAYYTNMQQRYFPTGWRKPLTIYLSKTQADTEQLLREHGHYANVDYGYYEPNVPAVYTHQFTNNGELNGWGALFHEITRHFMHQNFQNPPEWFKEGLASFLGDHMRIVKGKLVLVEPNPNMLQILKTESDSGRKFKVNNLFTTKKRQYYGLPGRCQFAQVFFYWLEETEQLKPYLANARQKGYEFTVLQDVLSKSLTKINNELADFIEANCQAAVHLQDAWLTEDHSQKQQAFLKVLQVKPDCRAAWLDLAKCYNQTGDYENCRKYLNQILNYPESAEFLQAATLMANTYYKQRDYTNALEYLNKAWEYSDCYEYKYKLAYRIGNCYQRLENPECATKWYQEFLNCNWEPEENEATINYAKKYIESANTAQVDCQKKH